jgi:hypothetical protein
MKHSKLVQKAAVAAALLAGLSFIASAHAKAGATDPIPGTSNSKTTTTTSTSTGGGGGGGGGGKTTTTVVVSPTPAPTPAPTPVTNPAPFVTATLTFTAVTPVNGVAPLCTGSYHIDPYYPTLSLMTVNVETSAVNAPDGTALFVNINGNSGMIYPFTSNVISTIGGYGLCTYSAYVTPGTVITSVTITDASGNVIASGK